jgi:SEC-C motif
MVPVEQTARLETGLLSGDRVRAEWDGLAALSSEVWEDEIRGFVQRQPYICAFALDHLADEPQETAELGLLVLAVIDRVFARAGRGDAPNVGADLMESTVRQIEERLEKLIGVTPDAAFDEFFFASHLRASAVVAELLAILAEAAGSDDVFAARVGPLLPMILAVQRAYEDACGLQHEESAGTTIAAAIEARTGQPFQRVGRNDPCPCGSGKKFKTCCLT